MIQATLLVGTGSGEVLLYDVASHQLVRSFTPLKDKAQGLAITHIECLLKPPDLIGNISLGFNVSSMTSAKDVIPTKPVMPFQRVRDGKARSLHEVSMMLPSSTEVNCVMIKIFPCLSHISAPTEPDIIFDVRASEGSSAVHKSQFFWQRQFDANESSG